MPGYRLTFGTQNLRARDMAETMIGADTSLGEAISGLSEYAEVLGHDYLISSGTAQFIIRFEAIDDDTALIAARSALNGVSLPVDNERLDRRSRRYVRVAR